MNNISFNELINAAIHAKHEPMEVRDQMSKEEYERFVFQMILQRLRESMGIGVNTMAKLMNMSPEEYEAIEHPIVFKVIQEDVFQTLKAELEYAYNKYPQGRPDISIEIDSCLDHINDLLNGEAANPKYRHEYPWIIGRASDQISVRMGYLAMGYKELGNLSDPETNYTEKVIDTYPTIDKQEIKKISTLAFNFSTKMKKGDYVIYSELKCSGLRIGIIDSDYYFVQDKSYPHRRKIEWIGRCSSTERIPAGILRELKTVRSIKQMRTVKMDELMAIAKEGEV